MAFNENGWRLIDETGFIEGEEPNGIRRKYAYVTNDTKLVVEDTGYFNAHISDLRIGDAIEVYGDLDGTPWHVTYVVNSVTSNVGITAAENLTFTAKYALTGLIQDVSTQGQLYIAVPQDSNILAVYTAINGDITGADVVLTIKAPDGTVGTITITHSGTVTGAVDSLTSGLSNVEVDAGEVIEVETGGESTGTIEVMVTILLAPR